MLENHKLISEADQLIGALGAAGHRYQRLAESLMYGEHGINLFGEDLNDEFPPYAADFERGQTEASRDFAALRSVDVIRDLRIQGFIADALEKLHASVGAVIHSTDLSTRQGRSDSSGLKAIFDVDVQALENQATDELDKIRSVMRRQTRRLTSSSVRPLARTADGDVAVGPNYMDVDEATEFIEMVIAELREPYQGFTEIGPGHFRPNATAGYRDPTGDGMHLYVKDVVVYVGSMPEVVSAWINNQLKYNTTTCDDAVVGDMCAAVSWLGGSRWGW